MMFSRFFKVFPSGKRISCFAATYSTCYRIIQNPELHSLRKGTGGRSSFNGIVATVFGATGFVGPDLVNRLGKIGTQIIIPYRREPGDEEVKSLKLAGDLGQILFQNFDLRDPHSIYKAVKHSNVVINLIGRDFETRNFSYKDVHVTGAKNIARACREMGVERLIHLSDLNVTRNPERFLARKPLQFLPTKLDGERAVFEEFPCATVIRPAAIFGVQDRLLWPINSRTRRSTTWRGQSVPLYKKGEATIKQPIFVSDVAQGIINAISDLNSKGKIYQAVGPKRYKLSELYDWCSRITERDCWDRGYRHDARFDPLLHMKLSFYSKVSHYEPQFRVFIEQFERESVTDIVDRKLPTLKDLGVEPQSIEIMRSEIYHQFLHASYYIRENYDPEISPPVEAPTRSIWDC